MRISFRETGGLQQEYSYRLSAMLPTGAWPLDEVPLALLPEVEAVGQSTACPPFLYSAEGHIVVEVTT